MSTAQAAAEPGNMASIANLASDMEVDPQTDNLALDQLNGQLKTTCTKNAICALNRLTDQHQAQYLRVIQVSGPLNHKLRLPLSEPFERSGWPHLPPRPSL